MGEWYYLALGGVVLMGVLFYLSLVGKELAYRETWLRLHAETSGKKARTYARIAANRKLAEQLRQTAAPQTNAPQSPGTPPE